MRPVKATVPVGKFEFGKIDGKKEARSPIFESIFYNGDGYFDDLTNDTNKYIIYGRKGTGKTLLVQYFLKQKSKEKNVFSRMVPPTSFSERKLAQFDYAGLKPEETEVFWKFVILKELSSIVLENERGVLNRKKLNKLRDVDSQLSMQLTEIVEENSNEISATMATSNLSVSGKNGVSSKSSFKVGKYYDKIDELSNNLKQVLETSKFTYFIAFDDLDELKTGVFVTLTAAKRIEKLAALLVDFVYALEEINDMLYEIGSNTRVLTTLRKDVVEQMQKLGSNINKPLTVW
ncbi:P-loop ATPase, Sll1717 family [Lacticaseibacillus saniviri]